MSVQQQIRTFLVYEMVGVLEVRRSVLPASRTTSKGEDRHCCCSHVSSVDNACPELTGDVQNRSTLLRCLVLHLIPHCLTGREQMPHPAFEHQIRLSTFRQ